MTNIKDQQFVTTFLLTPDKIDAIAPSKIIDFLSLMKEEDLKVIEKQNLNKSVNHDPIKYKKALKTPEILKLSKIRRNQEIIAPTTNKPNRIIYLKDIEAMKTASPQLKSSIHNLRIIEALKQSRKKRASSFDIGMGVSTFRENSKKYRLTTLQPLVKEEKMNMVNKSEIIQQDDDDVNGSAFLTNVNIQEIEKKEYSPRDESTEIVINHAVNNTMQILEKKIPNINKSNDIQHNLPTLKKEILGLKPLLTYDKQRQLSEKRVPISSQENFEKMTKVKPKLYISFKRDSIKQKGKLSPTNHYMKIFNGDGTPFLPQKMNILKINTFGSKKDTRRMTFDAYLSSYDPKALKDLNNLAFNEFYYDGKETE